jgi:heme A synthase
MRELLAIFAWVTTSHRRKEFSMTRAKNPENGPRPQPAGGSWLAGWIIGTTVIGLATGAMILGAGIAVKDASLKGR